MTVLVLVVLMGFGLVAAALVLHRKDQDADLAGVLRMAPWAREADDDEDEREESLSAMAGRAVGLAGQAVDRMDGKRSLSDLLERAKVPLQPGEFVIILTAGALGVAALLMVAWGSALIAAAGAVGAVLVTVRILRRRVKKRTQAFTAQLPDALSLVASSLSAGHTFGDLDMVVQAIRIQQTVGGRLADLFHTLSDVIRVRDEVKREVQILTAEGRMSAYVLAGLVPVLFLMMRIINPEYIEPLYSGTGLFILIGCAMSVVAGLFVILRMVKIEV